MKLLAVIGGSGVVVSGLYAGGALGAGEVYDVPLPAVKAELVAMPLPPNLLNSVGAIDVDVDAQQASVSWKLTRGSREVSKIVAHLRPAGTGRTLVTVEQTRASSAKGMEDRLTSTAFLRSFTQSSFEEQVAATLERRPYDELGAMRGFAEHAQTHPEEVRELGLAVGGMFQEVQKQMPRRERVHTVDAQRSMAAATRPSTNLE